MLDCLSKIETKYDLYIQHFELYDLITCNYFFNSPVPQLLNNKNSEKLSHMQKMEKRIVIHRTLLPLENDSQPDEQTDGRRQFIESKST